ncbi:zinc transporter ZupT [Desulfurivibrio sp. C05AmB]|jgi:zinc transporter, ZIP family|uniref:zinc transporter ZupT n=1 Tax=Desulfurivibrio sp. C05AmB TaxID=3374371 RepID=UPI00376F29EF
MGGFEFSAILFAFSLTLLAGLSTAIGGALAMFIRPHNTVGLSLGLGFSAGVMIYVSFVELLPEAMAYFARDYGEQWGYALATGAFFIGIAATALIDLLVPKDVNLHEFKKESEFSDQTELHAHKARSLKRTGMFTALAVAIHNFPEGFATFSVALLDPALAIPIAIAIAIHNIPEGVAVALPIYHGSGSRQKGFWYSLLSGLTEPLGAVAGFIILAPFLNEGSLGLIFALVAGIMIYISFDELFPSARLYGTAHTPIIGLLGGMLVMALSLVLFEFY